MDPAQIQTILGHALHAHLQAGPPAQFSWALYSHANGSIAVALAPSLPPDWLRKGGAEAELDAAKAEATRAIARLYGAQARPPLWPQAPTIAWTPKAAHGRLGALHSLAALSPHGQ